MHSASEPLPSKPPAVPLTVFTSTRLPHKETWLSCMVVFMPYADADEPSPFAQTLLFLSVRELLPVMLIPTAEPLPQRALTVTSSNVITADAAMLTAVVAAFALLELSFTPLTVSSSTLATESAVAFWALIFALPSVESSITTLARVLIDADSSALPLRSTVISLLELSVLVIAKLLMLARSLIV